VRSFLIRNQAVLLISGVTIAICVFVDVPFYLIMLIAASYCVWFVSAYRRHRHIEQHSLVKSSLNENQEKIMAERDFSEIDKYFFRLLISLNETTRKLTAHITTTLTLLDQMGDKVKQATDLAKNTELLAGNALMSATRCGEIGRGFVSVSKDIVGVSERAEQDLIRLLGLIQGLVENLSSVDFLPDNPALSWIEVELGDSSDFLLTNEQCFVFTKKLSGCLRMLDELHEKYESTSQIDVRWLQLGESVRRLITKLRDALQSLQNIAQHLSSDVQLLSLSEGLNRHQLVEIHKGFLQFGGQHDKMREIVS